MCIRNHPGQRNVWGWKKIIIFSVQQLVTVLFSVCRPKNFFSVREIKYIFYLWLTLTFFLDSFHAGVVSSLRFQSFTCSYIESDVKCTYFVLWCPVMTNDVVYWKANKRSIYLSIYNRGTANRTTSFQLWISAHVNLPRWPKCLYFSLIQFPMLIIVRVEINWFLYALKSRIRRRKNW